MPKETAVGAPGRPEPSYAANPARDAILAAMPERGEFHGHVVNGLKARGWTVWHVVDSRLMAAGLPDILAIHPQRPGVLLAWELKRQSRYPTKIQSAVIAHLATVPGVDARIVRPLDWLMLKETV